MLDLYPFRPTGRSRRVNDVGLILGSNATVGVIVSANQDGFNFVEDDERPFVPANSGREAALRNDAEVSASSSTYFRRSDGWVAR